MYMDRRNNLHFFDGDDYATHSEKWTLILFSGEENQMPLERKIDLRVLKTQKIIKDTFKQMICEMDASRIQVRTRRM